MTHMQYMMTVTDVEADYGYIKKSQETTNTSANTRLRANVDPRPVPCHRRRFNLEATSAHLSRWLFQIRKTPLIFMMYTQIFQRLVLKH